METKMDVAQTYPDLEPLARQLYEESRKRVSGRPKWEHLNQNDPYDMGMRSAAFTNAARIRREDQDLAAE